MTDWRDRLGQSPQLSVEAPLVVDIETVGTPFDGRVLVVGWQEVGEPRAHVALYDDVPSDVWAMVADPGRPFVSHTRYDARFLRLVGRRVDPPYHDTQVMAWVLDENQSLSLEHLARRYAQTAMDKRVVRSSGRVWFTRDDGERVPMDEAPLDELYAYCARDVEATVCLYETLWNLLEAEGWLDYYLAEEVPFTSVLVDMECRGLCIDVGATERLRDELEAEHARMEAALLEDGGLPPVFNLNSGRHLANYLFTTATQITGSIPCIPGEYNGMTEEERLETAQLVLDAIGVKFRVSNVGRAYLHGTWAFKGRGLSPGSATERSGQPATSKAALKTNIATASDPWVQDFLEYRQVDKLLTTYLRKFPGLAVDGRIYGRFNQTGTKTGRLSSSEPNLQNIPQRGKYGPRVRRLFKP